MPGTKRHERSSGAQCGNASKNFARPRSRSRGRSSPPPRSSTTSIKRKEATCREWKAVFNQFYARGRQNGARKETFASVVRKSAFGGALAAPLAFLVPFAFVPVLLALPVIVSVGLFTYFNHRRHHPDHDRYLAQENTHFAVIPDAPRVQQLSAPAPRLLSKGDVE